MGTESGKKRAVQQRVEGAQTFTNVGYTQTSLAGQKLGGKGVDREPYSHLRPLGAEKNVLNNSMHVLR